MQYYTSTTEFNCGIDLHARQMYACVMDRQGKKLVHTNIKGNDFEYFLKRVEPYRHDLTVACECIFNWYWLADACFDANIEFVLAHALYLKHIHGGKNKNDRIDSEKLAHLLRANLIPPSYIYPSERRPVRALLRQRMSYVWERATLKTKLSMAQTAEGLIPARKCGHNRDVWEERILAQYTHPLHRFAATCDMNMIRAYDMQIEWAGSGRTRVFSGPPSRVRCGGCEMSRTEVGAHASASAPAEPDSTSTQPAWLFGRKTR